MIAYDDLCQALSQWRVRQGLATSLEDAPTNYQAPAFTRAPMAHPPVAPLAAESVEHTVWEAHDDDPLGADDDEFEATHAIDDDAPLHAFASAPRSEPMAAPEPEPMPLASVADAEHEDTGFVHDAPPAYDDSYDAQTIHGEPAPLDVAPFDDNAAGLGDLTDFGEPLAASAHDEQDIGDDSIEEATALASERSDNTNEIDLDDVEEEADAEKR